MAARESERHGLLRTIKDLTSGAVGGIAQVLLGKDLELYVLRSITNPFINCVSSFRLVRPRTSSSDQFYEMLYGNLLSFPQSTRLNTLGLLNAKIYQIEILINFQLQVNHSVCRVSIFRSGD